MSFAKGSGMAGKGGKDPSANAADMDWICRMCRERNFSKRAECFKCKSPRTADAEMVQSRSLTAPPNGTTLTGMVKSYNKKGFGFIMSFGEYSQDIYYTRENVSSRLLHPDMPGEQVSFEVYRERGKLVAKNVRPIGEDRHSNINCGKYGGGKGVTLPPKGGEGDEFDRSWICPSCREHNFSRRNECFKCKLPRPAKDSSEAPKGFTDAPKGFSDGPPKVAARPPPPAPRKTFSPHAGARAIRESLVKGRPCDGRSSSSSPRRPYKKAKKKKRKRKSSSRSTSSSGSSRDKKKSKKRRSPSQSSSSSSRRKRSRSRSSSSNIEVVASKKGDGGSSSEIEQAKADALKQLMKLKEIESKDARMTEFRALLRQWHPDKNLDRVEVATAVFQFLQKGKMIVANAS
mmetsp:Transcript_83687/g.159779  ORF Transcript_83687/g.159779 Transcript_83687/m.159779 type:complete len:402 (-) Transcript_83687:74-1279(-)